MFSGPNCLKSHPRIFQKTREGCGCFRGLFGGSRGKLRESPEKIAGNISRVTKCDKFYDFRHRERQTCLEPWVDTPGTLSAPSVRGLLFKSTVPAFSSFSAIFSMVPLSMFLRRQAYHRDVTSLILWGKGRIFGLLRENQWQRFGSVCLLRWTSGEDPHPHTFSFT